MRNLTICGKNPVSDVLDDGTNVGLMTDALIQILHEAAVHVPDDSLMEYKIQVKRQERLRITMAITLEADVLIAEDAAIESVRFPYLAAFSNEPVIFGSE